jgi:putative DNA primase/helicase
MRFLAATYTLGADKTLRRWRSGWWRWEQTRWVEAEDEEMRGRVYRFTRYAKFINEAGARQDWDPNDRRVTAVLDALKSPCELDNTVEQPSWLDGRSMMGTVVIACRNGLLDVRTRTLSPHTPAFFNCGAVEFDFDPNAPEPKAWIGFTGSAWPTSPNSTLALEEMLGYFASGLTHLQKILMLVGDTRCGKGTIGRLTRKLLGASVVGTSFDDLSGPFGLERLIGASVGIISDAHFVGKEVARAIERMLSISGEDQIMVNRKGRPHWIGTLRARLMVLANKLPRLHDASTAIVGRLIILPMLISWLGREDHGLDEKLAAELPGILNRCLDGLERVLANGKFTHVPEAEEYVRTMTHLASPVTAYVDECCVLDPMAEDEKAAIYGDYAAWCRRRGHVAASYEVFVRDLLAAFPAAVTVKRGQEGGKRIQKLKGIMRIQRTTANVVDFPTTVSFTAKPEAG